MNNSGTTLINKHSVARRIGAPARLQLTSLVDMMVILVVFLLKSFSADGQLVNPAAGLELPQSSSQNPVTSGLVIEISLKSVLVDGIKVLNTVDLKDLDSRNAEILEMALSRFEPTTGVLIQADKKIKYEKLGQALSACSHAGFADVSLIVMEGES